MYWQSDCNHHYATTCIDRASVARSFKVRYILVWQPFISIILDSFVPILPLTVCVYSEITPQLSAAARASTEINRPLPSETCCASKWLISYQSLNLNITHNQSSARRQISNMSLLSLVRPLLFSFIWQQLRLKGCGQTQTVRLRT